MEHPDTKHRPLRRPLVIILTLGVVVTVAGVGFGAWTLARMGRASQACDHMHDWAWRGPQLDWSQAPEVVRQYETCVLPVAWALKKEDLEKAHYAASFAYLEMGDYIKATEAFKKGKVSSFLWLNTGREAMIRRKEWNFLAEFSQGLPSPGREYYAALVEIEQGHADNALALLKTVLAMGKTYQNTDWHELMLRGYKDGEPYWLLARAYWLKSDRENARQAVSQYLAEVARLATMREPYEFDTSFVRANQGVAHGRAAILYVEIDKSEACKEAALALQQFGQIDSWYPGPVVWAKIPKIPDASLNTWVGDKRDLEWYKAQAEEIYCKYRDSEKTSCQDTQP